VFEVSLVKVLSCSLFVSAENAGWAAPEEKRKEEKTAAAMQRFENAAIDVSSLSASVRANGLRND
jgi:hypothetical protein